MIFDDNDTIVAPSTPAGGALCIIRMSGARAISICDDVFRGRRPLAEAATATAHYGRIVVGDEVVDDVVVTVFRAPHSYTGEDSVEITAHGSRYIMQRIVALLTSCGARMAEAGEFTRRAFLAGRMDLSQAEAVADIIASDSRASAAVASTQMRGAYSEQLHALRQELLHILSLLELELDFSEEDVEFADRTQLASLLDKSLAQISSLASSFALGNVLKHGVTVAIAGRPNVGKSTLLNRLAGEDRAMVSDVAGTTRDTIEVVTNIGGVTYRFVDTAGLHASDDRLERMGMQRTEQALRKARIVLWLTDDPRCVSDMTGRRASDDLPEYIPAEGQTLITVITKSDLHNIPDLTSYGSESSSLSRHETSSTTERVVDAVLGRMQSEVISLSAKTGEGIDMLIDRLQTVADASSAYDGSVIVTNQRHYEALCHAADALTDAVSAMHDNTPSDLLCEHIRIAASNLGTITGEITSQDILENIFSKFCVGK